MASVRQIHSAAVLTADGARVAGEGDALLTSHAGLAVSIRTADCYPILLADQRRRIVAAVHAGWRGTAGRIVANTLAAMHREFGCNPEDVRAAIGPGIGVCCYEVGPEVAQQFGLGQASRIDLAAINRNQLIDAGVPADAIEIMGGCTRCDATLFHSFRRDRAAAGRMISFIRIAEVP
jgi:YfiH family protein